MIRAAAEGRKSERDRASATRRVEPGSWQHGASAVHAATPQRDPHGRHAILPTFTGVRRTADRRRKESRFAVLEEMKRDTNERARARDKERRTNEWQRRGWRGKGREDKRAEREREGSFELVAQATKFSARSLEISGKRLAHSEYMRRPRGFYLFNAFLASWYAVSPVIATVIVIARRNRIVSRLR